MNVHSLNVSLLRNYVTSPISGSTTCTIQTLAFTSLQIFLNLPTLTISLSDKKIKDLRLLLLHVKQYHYERKTIQEKATTSEFMSKLIIQLKIDS